MTEDINKTNDSANAEPITEPEVQNQVQPDERGNEILKLQTELSRLREQIVDPEYLEMKANKNVPKPDVFELPDFEAMSNKDLVKSVVTMSEKRFSKLAADLQGKIDALAAGISNFVAKTSVEGLQSKYKDFGVLQNDVLQILREKPNYDIEDAYKLAKYNAGQRATSNTGVKIPARAATQRELPKDNVSSTVEKKEYKTTKDAAEAAWNALVGEKTTLEG